MREEKTYPEAACSPRPREPPVTTITLPFKEKMLGKSWRSVSELDIVKSGMYELGLDSQIY